MVDSDRLVQVVLKPLDAPPVDVLNKNKNSEAAAFADSWIVAKVVSTT